MSEAENSNEEIFEVVEEPQSSETPERHDDVTDEISEEAARQELIAELDELIANMKSVVPDYEPPPLSPRGMVQSLGENLRRFSPEVGLDILHRLRYTLGEDLFDVDTWKGVWYMVNYTLEYQADILRRRMSGDYETDEWGFDAEVLQVVEPFIRPRLRSTQS